MPKSIFHSFTGLHENGKPLDFVAIWKKTFEQASEKNVALFQKTYSDGWCEYLTPQMSLTAEVLVVKHNIRFMATLIGDESPTPLRRADGFDIWRMEIPRIGHRFPLQAREYRKLMEVYESPRLTEANKVNAIKKTLTDNMQNAYLGCKDVMDFILLTMLSNWGVAQFKPEINNPSGRLFEIDYMLPDSNKLISSKLWSTENTKAGKLVPLLVLAQVCSDLRSRGIMPGEILMSQKLYSWLKSDPTTRLMAHGTDKQAMVVGKSEFESLLDENEIPHITVVNRKMAVSKDGGREEITPWNDNFIAIKPAGVFADIQPAIEDSALMPEDNVDYFDAGNGVRIAKWRTGESTGQTATEYTQGSARMIPLLRDAGSVVCMQVRGFEEKVVTGREYYTTKEEHSKGVAIG